MLTRSLRSNSWSALRPGLLFLKSVHPLVPVNDHQWSTTATLTTGTVEAQALEEIADTIQADGIVLEMYHSEGAPGQVRPPDLANVSSQKTAF